MGHILPYLLQLYRSVLPLGRADHGCRGRRRSGRSVSTTVSMGIVGVGDGLIVLPDLDLSGPQLRPVQLLNCRLRLLLHLFRVFFPVFHSCIRAFVSRQCFYRFKRLSFKHSVNFRGTDTVSRSRIEIQNNDNKRYTQEESTFLIVFPLSPPARRLPI